MLEMFYIADLTDNATENVALFVFLAGLISFMIKIRGERYFKHVRSTFKCIPGWLAILEEIGENRSKTIRAI